MSISHVIDKEFPTESLRINKSKEKAKGVFRMISFIDADTNQNVLFLPSLGISSYGKTKEKALEMLDESLDDYFLYLTSLPQKRILTELHSLGWSQVQHKSKEYSKAYIDISGELKDFNVENNQVIEKLITV